MPSAVFADRADAGRRLGAVPALHDLPPDRVVIGVAGAGITTATEVAGALGAPLFTVVTAPIRVPVRDTCIGSVGPNGVALVDRTMAERLHVDRDWLDASIAGVRRTVLRRQAALVPGLPPVRDRDVLVVDDYAASGATAASVGRWLRHAHAASGVLAVGAVAGPALVRLEEEYDGVVALVRTVDAAAAGAAFASATRGDR